MAGLVPFNNRRRNALDPVGAVNNMLEDFFSDSWPIGRNLMRDTFKVDVRESDGAYLIEAELPGVTKEEIDLDLYEGRLTISVNRQEDINEENGSYIHRERRLSSMSRSIHLTDCSVDGIKAKLENGILLVTVDKQEKKDLRQKINID